MSTGTTTTTATTTAFTAESTAAQVLDGVDLTGLRAIVTGATSGIGAATARALALAGATVTLAVRDVGAAETVRAAIVGASTEPPASLDRPQAHPNRPARVEVAPLDLADAASVRAFVGAWTGPLHILVNNAAVMATPWLRTPQGFEVQFATNHLGHFALTTGLHRALAAGAAESGASRAGASGFAGARIVSVTSNAHQRFPVEFDDIHFERRPYDPWAAYGQSKTANVLLVVEATRRWAAEGISSNAAMPGRVATNLRRYTTDAELARMRAASGAGTPLSKTVEQGAATSVLLAGSPLLHGVSGCYFEDCAPAVAHEVGTRRGVAAHALDPHGASRLWRACDEMLR
jgi:NAD(P)-dependent dehydrogenase (short-subunit alcohol dehydrogenase family)